MTTTPTISPEEEARYAELQDTALDFARAGQTEELRKMLEAGLAVNLADHKGQSLLMLATYHGHEATAAMLLEEGAEPDRVNDRGQTPLAGAVFKGHFGIVKLLCEHGADPKAGGLMSPTACAYMFGQFKIAAYFKSLKK